MAVTNFKDASYSLAGLISRIEYGEIGLPDIQRPFVWTNAKVRDLFDSMYKGFPVGYLLFWSTSAESGTLGIGLDRKQTAPSLLIVDGQQRLTSLYSVMTGTPVRDKKWKERQIRVAFCPAKQSFEVTNAVIARNPEYLPDISVLFQGGVRRTVNRFLKRLEEHRERRLTEDEEDTLEENIDRLRDLQNYPFQVIELDREVDEEQVAEVFVRINSQGARLNAADFIMTLMSVFWEEGRIDIEEFGRRSRVPAPPGEPSPFNHFINPEPVHLLRVSVGLAFRRAQLRNVYSILRGKDLKTGDLNLKQREQQFRQLKKAHSLALDPATWQEFLSCIDGAGYRSSRLITSKIAVIYAYVMWLIGSRDYQVDPATLKHTIARWWFMTNLTSRYTGSFETRFESDLAGIRGIPSGDADGFCAKLDSVIRDTLTGDYWSISLPNLLDTTSSKSPALSSYWAAQILLDAEVLFSNEKVSNLLDPRITPTSDMTRDHLFPKRYLHSIGVRSKENRIANMTFIDRDVYRTLIGQSPAEFSPSITQHMDPERPASQLYHHALPQGWEQLDYEEFCRKRRNLMAQVIRAGFETLQDKPVVSYRKSLAQIITGGESNLVEFKQSARWSYRPGSKEVGKYRKSEQVIIKTLAGFMNRDGGTLLIGVADNGSIIGVEPDYQTLSRRDRDAYELYLTQLIMDKLSGASQTLCHVSFEPVNGKQVCRIDVSASAREVFASPPTGKEKTDFWVRMGNRTERLWGTEQSEYIKQRF